MKTTLNFTKMHGISNDYIYIDCFESTPKDPAQLSRQMSPRRTAVGSDGIALILPSKVADGRMRLFNADGSEANMCGNGIRCVGKYMYDNGLVNKTDITIETGAGIMPLKMTLGQDDKVEQVTVNMGRPVFSSKAIPLNYPKEEMVQQQIEYAPGKSVLLTTLLMGVPHAVTVVDCDPMEVDVHAIGKSLEWNPIFPNRANINFIQLQEDGSLKMRVWERGSGETWACGTGASACAVVADRLGLSQFPILVHLRGGDLLIDRQEDGTILMTGPAVTVFKGQWEDVEMVPTVLDL